MIYTIWFFCSSDTLDFSRTMIPRALFLGALLNFSFSVNLSLVFASVNMIRFILNYELCRRKFFL